MTEAGHRSLVVRVWLPDRPGALGAVASRIGAVGGDLHEIEVVDRVRGRAVDEFLVTVPLAVSDDLVARELAAVDGVDVEDLRPIDYEERDPRLGSLEAAVALAEADGPGARDRALVDHARRELRADWAAVVGREAVGTTAGEGPGDGWLQAFGGGVLAGDQAGPSPRGPGSGGSGPDGIARDEEGDVAWAVLPGGRRTLLAGRSGVPFRPRERRVLVLLARLA